MFSVIIVNIVQEISNMPTSIKPETTSTPPTEEELTKWLEDHQPKPGKLFTSKDVNLLVKSKLRKWLLLALYVILGAVGAYLAYKWHYLYMTNICSEAILKILLVK